MTSNPVALPRFVSRRSDEFGPGFFAALTEAQARVLTTFVEHGDMTDFQLGYAYRLLHGELDQSWSGLRTRRSELVDMGALLPVSEIRNERNRRVTVWGEQLGLTFTY
jgi:hypothetical protein